MKRLRNRFQYLCFGTAAGILLAVIASFPHQTPVNAVAGTATFTGTEQTLTGDITAARLVDQANSAYLIDPAASGNSLITAGAASVSGNLVLNAAATIQTTNMQPLTIGSSTTGLTKVTSGGKLELQAGGTGTGSTGTGSIYFLDSSGGVTGRFDSTAGSGSWPSGDGADGAITVSVDKNINTDTLASGRSCADGGDAVNYSVTASVAAAATSVTLSSTPSSGCLAAGDEVLIINLQGTSGDNANVGKYETKTISAISGATLTVSALTNAYDGTTQKIMVQRIPNYTNVTVNTGITLTANAWDGTKGGVLFFRANGTVTVTGTISMASKGFRGGTTSLAPENGTGRPTAAGGGGGGGGGGGYITGTGASGGSPSGGTGANGGYNADAYGGNGGSSAGGGGGGGNNDSNCSQSAGGTTGGGRGANQNTDCGSGTAGVGIAGTAGTGGGGGGSYRTAGQGGGDSAGGGGGGGGAKAYNSLTNSTPTTFATVFLGGGSSNGGGGGGGGGNGNGNGGVGGNSVGTGGNGGSGTGSGVNGSSGGSGNPGGGIVIIKANSVTSTGTITADGGAGGTGGAGGNGGVSSNVGGGGGGGGYGANGAAGGSVFIHAPTINLSANDISAAGGSGGSGASGGTGGSATYPGGAGGSGGSGSTGGDGVIRIVYTTNDGSLTHSPTPTTSTTLESSPYGTLYLGGTNTSAADLAEYYVSGDPSISAGDVVVISPTRVILEGAQRPIGSDSIPYRPSGSRVQNDEEVETKGVLMKAEKAYDSKLVGIISTNPGVLMGSIDGENKEDKRMLALAGRVPVKIDPDSPAIAVGDFLTSGSRPGLAAKATRPGYVVARALESWSPGDPELVEAFIQLTYFMGDIDEHGDFRNLEVDTLKVNKTLQVGGVNVLDRITKQQEEIDALKASMRKLEEIQH